MIIKDYFTDGLVQVAIVLSLLRTDLDSYFTSSHIRSAIRPHQPLHRPQEADLGPLSGFTSTDLIIRDREFSAGYPKTIEDAYHSRFSSLLNDLHSLSYYRRFDGIDRNFHTWLVNEVEPVRSVTVRSDQAPVADANEQSNSPGAVATDESAASSSSAEGQLGSELTKEDMELINILYMQDIDLGVGRDAFDVGLLKNETEESVKQEQEDPLLQDKKQANDTQPSQSSQNEFPQLDLSGHYAIDTETGELILVSSSPVTEEPLNTPELSRLPLSEPSLAGHEHGVLPHIFQNEGMPDMTPVPYVVADTGGVVSSITETYEVDLSEQSVVGHEHELNVDQDWDDVLSVLNVTAEPSFPDVNNTWHNLSMEYGNAALVQNVSMVSASAPAVTDLIALHSDMYYTPSVPFLNRQLVNESSFLPPVYNNVNSNALLVEPVPSADFGLQPNLSLITDLHTNLSMDANMTSELSQFFGQISDMTADHQDFTYDSGLLSSAAGVTCIQLGEVDSLTEAAEANISTPLPLSDEASMADTNALFQQLLQSDLLDEDIDDIILEDMVENNEAAGYHVNDAWSTDSAVSSMGSPGQQSCAGSSFMFSENVESFSAGTGVADSMSPNHDSSGKNEEASYKFVQSFLPYSPSSQPRASSSSNSSDFFSSTTSPIASAKHIQHNHTYPLAPGQRSRSELEEEARREREEHATRSRDEKRAKAMKIPLTMDEIIDSSVEHFTELLSHHDLSDSQLQLVRDIRRRGKNKLAAQNCRKRKMEVIQTVEEQVTELRRQRDQLLRDRANLDREAASLKEKFMRMEMQLFRSLHDESGREYDPAAYSLLQTDDGGFFIVPRDNSTTMSVEKSHDEKNSRKRKPKKKE